MLGALVGTGVAMVSGIFGGGSDTTSKSTIDTSVLNENIMSVISKNTNVTEILVDTDQKISVSNSEIVGCNVTFENIVQGKIEVISEIKGNLNLELINDINNKIDAASSSNSETYNGFLSLAASGTTSSITDVINDLKNRVETKIQAIKYNELLSNIKVNQDIEIHDTLMDPCALRVVERLNITDERIISNLAETFLTLCDPSACNFTNKYDVEVLSKVTTTAVVEAVTDFVVANDMVLKAEAEARRENQGIGGAFGEVIGAMSDALGNLLSSPIFWVIGIVFILGIVGYLIYSFSSGGNGNGNGGGKGNGNRGGNVAVTLTTPAAGGGGGAPTGGGAPAAAGGGGAAPAAAGGGGAAPAAGGGGAAPAAAGA